MYILIAENDVMVVRFLAAFLRRSYSGCYIRTARRISRAWELLIHEPPFDLVLIEGHLPDGEGASLVESIHKAYLGPPFIGLSDDPQAREELRLSGCVEVFDKPFDPAALDDAIRRACFPHAEEEDHDTTHAGADLAAAGPDGRAVLRAGAGDRGPAPAA